MAGDWNTVVSDHQRAQFAAFYLALAKEFKLLDGHSQRLWALGKARAAQWVYSDSPEQVQLGILVTAAVEVFPEETKRIVQALTGDKTATPIDLGGKWLAVLNATNE